MDTYAHSGPGAPGPQWHRLDDHLKAVGEGAGRFASSWGGAAWARAAGLWHDLGKAAPDWQEFLREAGREAHVQGEESPGDPPTGRRRGPDHSSAGAVHAQRVFGAAGLPIQFVIAGHHAGLADRPDLASRLKEKQERYEKARAAGSRDILGFVPELALPESISGAKDRDESRRLIDVFTRMVFSALVDADFLDTERFYASIGDESRDREAWPALDAYLPVLDSHLVDLESAAPASAVNEQRRRVLRWCRAAASGPRGAYTLTVPTGGGKTLSSLAFALAHARHHGLARVIVALPFISILDQTASVLAEVFEPLGRQVLVEHHSAIDPRRETASNRLASENWDAPLIVTTQVQLFESLFSNRPSRCRKLHNLADSVLILDEVQSLPVGLLAPILDQLQELRRTYGLTLLLTTATQPALHSRPLGAGPFRGLNPAPREIVPAGEMPSLFGSLRRVMVRWPSTKEVISWPSLAGDVAQRQQALAIVDKRADALALWTELKAVVEEPPLHLSALMCPAHRKEVLGQVRAALREPRCCRLVSTQVVEAGVDVDFPVVYRAMAGLESLAQSAGRCNREGRLEFGDFHVFNSPTEPPGILKHHRDIAAVMLKHDPNLDLMTPETFRQYFDRLYSRRSLDSRGIQALRQELRFESTAAEFRMIDDATETVFVPYGAAGRRAIEALRHGGPSRGRFRALQPFGVAVYPRDLGKLVSATAVDLVHESVYVLTNELYYDSNTGLRVEVESLPPMIA